jgi:hypothetical protein
MEFSTLIDISTLSMLPPVDELDEAPASIRESETRSAPGVRPDLARPTDAKRASYRPHLSAEPAAGLPELLERFRDEISGFLAGILIDNNTGMPICILSDAEHLDAEAVGAFYRDLSSSALSALSATGKERTSEYPLEEILITSKDDYAILRVLNKGQQLLYLLIDGESNPGMARVVARRYTDQLEAFLS